MRFVFFFTLLFSQLVFADAVIFSGNDVKALKYNLDLFGRSKVMGLAADPSAGGGQAAPLGSIGMDFLTGNVYIKNGAGNTNWIDVTGSIVGTANTAAAYDANGILNPLAAISTTEMGYLDGVTASLCGISQSCTLTNKSIDADTNTITNIENADIKTGAAIDAAKIANGTVSSTEFQYIGGLTSDAQTQLDAKVPKSDYTASGDVLVGTGAGTYSAVQATDQSSAATTIVRRDSSGYVELARIRNASGADVYRPDNATIRTGAGSLVIDHSSTEPLIYSGFKFGNPTNATLSNLVTFHTATNAGGATTHTYTWPVNNSSGLLANNGTGTGSWVSYSSSNTANTVVQRDTNAIWGGSFRMSGTTGKVELLPPTNNDDINFTFAPGAGDLGHAMIARNSSTSSETAMKWARPYPSTNLIDNGEAEYDTTGWTSSGGTFARTTTAANIGGGVGSFGWNSSSSSQSLDSGTTSIPAGNYGRNGVVSCAFQTPSGAATYLLQAYDGTNVLASQTITSSTNYSRTSVNFVFPNSGSVLARIVSVAADEPQIYFDDCYLGLAEGFNVSQVSQAEQYGTIYFPPATNCTWNSASTSYANFAEDTDCATPTVTGNASAPSTEIPGIKFSRLPPGKYSVVVTGMLGGSDGSTTNGAYFRISDGTNASSPCISFHGTTGQVIGGGCTFDLSYTSESSNVTLQMQAATVGSGGTPVSIITASNTSLAGFKIAVYRFPTTAETAIAANQAPSWGTLKYAATSNCFWSHSTAGFTSFAADTDCATPTVAGNATASGTKIPGFVVSNLPAGTYKVTAIGQFEQGGSSVTSPRCGWQIWDGTNSGGSSRSGNTVANEASNDTSLHGVFTYSAVQPSLTFQIRADRAVGDGTCSIYGANSDLVFAIEPLSQSLAAPILVGSVTSNSAGAERQERAVVVCSASSSISSQSGTWLTAIGNRSSGACALTIATGMFSARPTCTVQAEGTSTTNIIYPKVSGFSATGFTITGVEQASGTTAATTGDITYNIHCQGPR